MSDNQDRLAQLRADVEKLVDEARQMSEGRTAQDFTADELARLEEIEQLTTHWREQIDAYERAARLTAEPRQAQAAPQRRTAPASTTRTASTPLDPRCGFAHFGEFALALQTTHGANLDHRLAQMAATTYSAETVGADGGYLVPPEFSSRIMQYVGEQASLYSRCDVVPVNHSLYWPVDEQPPWSTTGPYGRWEGEADTYAQQKISIRTAGQKLNKCVVLCPVTDELVDDAPQLGAYLQSMIGQRIRWKVDDAILNGTGVGMPLGINVAPALKAVDKEAAQTATTFVDHNLFAMWTAMLAEHRQNAVWIANQDVESQLLNMTLAGASSDVPIWLPAGSQFATAANAPNGTLMGRPLILHQACQTLGAQGDVYFCDMTQYIIGQKTSGPQFATSIHLYFDQGIQAIRATWRMAGMPKWSTTISAANGTATYSPFVAVAVRA